MDGGKRIETDLVNNICTDPSVHLSRFILYAAPEKSILNFYEEVGYDTFGFIALAQTIEF
jgi:hypothetical protein